MGSILMVWDGITLNSPPLDWIITSPDIVEAKVSEIIVESIFN